MSADIAGIAEAFSGHRFAETYEHIAAGAKWVAVGEAIIEGRDAIIAACDASAVELAATVTEFTRFVTVAGAEAVAVDAIGRYTDDVGAVSVVSSCDIYEFSEGQLNTITSYAVELTP
jgi:hypothetical protein